MQNTPVKLLDVVALLDGQRQLFFTINDN